ncbi:hypothetical protein KCTC32420_01352 [Aequorivita nionensis]
MKKPARFLNSDRFKIFLNIELLNFEYYTQTVFSLMVLLRIPSGKSPSYFPI